MANRKSTKKYYFSVEGETEEWYLLWLRDLINSTEEAAFKVAIDCKIEKDPLLVQSFRLQRNGLQVFLKRMRKHDNIT